MASLRKLLENMSDYLDRGRPDVPAITLRCKRPTAMRAGAKPKKRGGPLYFRGREIVLKPPGEA
jgi:hypothetical protein